MHSDVAVVGGGIGGLGAALSMFRASFDVHVYEQAHALREVGAGIQVSPNASRVLHGFGLADELAKLGVRPSAHHQRRWDNGRTLLKTPLSDTVIEAFGFPHYQSHRADVLSMLIAALPTERLHIGHRLIAFTDRGNRVDAEFDNGKRITTDAIIGAGAAIRSLSRGSTSFTEGACLSRFSGGTVRALACQRGRGCVTYVTLAEGRSLECPLWVISGQTVLGQNPAMSALSPIADKRELAYRFGRFGK
jgi:2-polyprenyl-6-methoxyphenol hydroxylase-like FAD-dependent oxidoreductase